MPKYPILDRPWPASMHARHLYKLAAFGLEQSHDALVTEGAEVDAAGERRAYWRGHEAGYEEGREAAEAAV